jgi:hypothetical protein
MNSKIQLIISMDIAGYTGNHIAEALGMTPPRISIIRNSPLYIQERDHQWALLKGKVTEKLSDKVAAGDPVEAKIKDMALTAVTKYQELLEAKSEFVQKATADSILDRAGYRAKTDKTVVSVEVTDKMASRFEKILGYTEDGGVETARRVTTITRTVE